MQFVLENHKTQACDGYFSKLYFLSETQNEIAIIGNFGIGSPIACAILEELIAFGVKKFISIGVAGTLQKNIKIGDLVLCDKAIRDEGTSYHYIKKSKYAYPSKELTNRLAASLIKNGNDFHTGASWTIDAIYRETVAEARHYQQEGVATVEMEAAGLFAVAEYQNVEMASVFTISDSLADLVWHPEFHSNATREGLEQIYSAAVGSF
jgi:uridine phosphorylase